MDSVTQFALGAAVGEAVLGRKVGSCALLWGGICGTIPDLDVFLSFGDPVKDFTYHRSFSHSIFILALLTPIIVALILRLHAGTRVCKWHWYLLVYLVFVTHVLLDCCTAYGTQILWPIITTPISWSTIFIIDPVYTLPLLAGIVAALLLSRQNPLGNTLNSIGLAFSALYLAWTIGAKWYVDNMVEHSLDGSGIDSRVFFSTPTPFNSLLWRVVVMEAEGYYEGFYSVFDGDRPIPFQHYTSRVDLLNDIKTDWSVRRLQWFSNGIYAVKQEHQSVVISDLRMGYEPNYVFRFVVGRIANASVFAIRPIQLESTRDYSALVLIWRRIWDASRDTNLVPKRK